MTTTVISMDIDERRATAALQELSDKLDAASGKIILDFAAVHRIHASVLRGLEELAHAADQKGLAIVLRCVGLNAYRVLKLVRLTRRFSFEN